MKNQSVIKSSKDGLGGISNNIQTLSAGLPHFITPFEFCIKESAVSGKQPYSFQLMRSARRGAAVGQLYIGNLIGFD